MRDSWGMTCSAGRREVDEGRTPDQDFFAKAAACASTAARRQQVPGRIPGGRADGRFRAAPPDSFRQLPG